MRAGLLDVPVEVLLDYLLPYVALSGLAALTSTCRVLAAICGEDSLWKQKCRDDFEFHRDEVGSAAGWRVLYWALHRPKVFVWGDNQDGRLGPAPEPHIYGVPSPTMLGIPGRRIVKLVAGGSSFHALDSVGRFYVWGALDGRRAGFRIDDFSQPSKIARCPYELLLPTRIETISCGCAHTVALDAALGVWTFYNWARPFKLVSPLLDCSSQDTTPLQAEAGLYYSAILTQSGDVLVYWNAGTLRRTFMARMKEMDDSGLREIETTTSPRIQCTTWDIEHDPYRLPPLPSLPELYSDRGDYEDDRRHTKLVKIAGMAHALIGLTNEGHVLKYNHLRTEQECMLGSWQYLPNFSDPAALRNCVPSDIRPVPEKFCISHITAYQNTFAAYSAAPSVILMGDATANPFTSVPALPSVQGRSIISVELGEDHHCALTSNGELLTWGSFSNGALGLGDPLTLPVGAPGGYPTEELRSRARAMRLTFDVPRVEHPTEVKFNDCCREINAFVLAAAAGGWQSGALVADLGIHIKHDIRQPSKSNIPETTEASNSSMLPSFAPSTVPTFPEH